MEALKTKTALRKQERNQKIRNRYNDLISVDGSMKTAINEKVMEEFGIGSISTLYEILKQS